jgi:glycosyl transferase family 25
MNQFNQLYYINLECRKDMYVNINNVIDNIQFDRNRVTRINAIKKNNGAYGCALSHILALEDAKKNNYDTILILEDDFELFNLIESKEKIIKFLQDVEEWDLLNLSCHLLGKKNCGIENVIRVLNGQSTIAYAVKNHFIDKLLEVFYESAEMLSKIQDYEHPCPYCIDVNWKKLQKNSKWYCFYPFLGREYPKYSDVQNKFIDHFGDNF